MTGLGGRWLGEVKLEVEGTSLTGEFKISSRLGIGRLSKHSQKHSARVRG